MFVLVHGGWHGAWCWDRLAPLLRAAGHEVHAPTLTGLGDPTPPASRIGLVTHVDDVVERLQVLDLHGVVLVGHSSGGAVITGVAQRVPARLAALVYLDAFVPQPGQSVLDLLPPERRAHFLAHVSPGDRILLDWEAAMDGWAVRERADRDWMRPRLRPHPLGALADPLPTLEVADLPRHFVHCTDKPAGDGFAGFADAARRDPGWRFDVLDAGHDAMITAPRRVQAVLDTAHVAGATGRSSVPVRRRSSDMPDDRGGDPPR